MANEPKAPEPKKKVSRRERSTWLGVISLNLIAILGVVAVAIEATPAVSLLTTISLSIAGLCSTHVAGDTDLEQP